MIANAIQKLKAQDHPAPVSRIAQLFGFQNGDPDPLLGIIPITENDVQILIPDLASAGGTKNPMFISAQGSGKGSIEAHGKSSFVVTCNQLAAGAIAGKLQSGAPPFVVQCALKEQFYIEACQITLDIDVDKVLRTRSPRRSAPVGFLGIDSFALSAAYANTQTTGGIVIDVKMDSGVLTDDQKKWIQQNVDDLQKKAWDMVKSDIFDWDPSKTDTPATTDRGIISSLFGGSSVSIKANYQRRGIHFTDTIRLTETITVVNNISGDLNDLIAAVKANPDKYLAIVDIGKWFQKVQVAAMSAVNFNETLPDGTSLRDPAMSVQLEAGLPELRPADRRRRKPQPADSRPGLPLRARAGEPAERERHAGRLDQGRPRTTSSTCPGCAWTTTCRTGRPIRSGWCAPSPMTETTHGSTSATTRSVTPGRMTPRSTHRSSPPPRSATCTSISSWTSFCRDRTSRSRSPARSGRARTHSRSLRTTRRNVIWEIFSDKFVNTTQFTYQVQVEVAPPETMFGAAAVLWQLPALVTVAIPAGRIKYINPYKIVLPAAPVDQLPTINSYIVAASA